MDMSDLDALLDDLGSTYRRPSVSRTSTLAPVSAKPASSKLDMADLDDLISEWEAPPPAYHEVDAPHNHRETVKVDNSTKSEGTLDLEAELNALTAGLQAPMAAKASVSVKHSFDEPENHKHKPMAAKASVSVKPSFDETDHFKHLQDELDEHDSAQSPKRRTQILQAHGQQKNPFLDSMLKDLSKDKAFENPIQAIEINPKIGANPKATITQKKSPIITHHETAKQHTAVSSPPPRQEHSPNVPKFTPSSRSVSNEPNSQGLGVRAKRKGFCPSCGLSLAKSGGATVTAGGADWHKECFTCNFCKQVMKDKFMVFKEEVYHHPCVVQLAKLKGKPASTSAPAQDVRCKVCSQIIGIGDIIFLGDRSKLHKHCFKCSSCSCQLQTNDLFNDESGRMICGNCARR